MAMAGITKWALRNPLFSRKTPTRPLAGVFDAFSTRTRGESPRRKRPQHRHQCSLASINALCNNNAPSFDATISTQKGNQRAPLFSGSAVRGRPASVPRSSNARATCRRRVHGQSTTEPSHPGENSDDDSSERTQKQSDERRPTSDPTAKRPTVKCDPYGLQGESLSLAGCADWMSTLEGGWALRGRSEDDAAAADDDDGGTGTPPLFLVKRYYHPTFHEASQFLSRISLIATNINHFPFLSMERILVDDLGDVHGGRDDGGGAAGGNSIVGGDDTNDNGNTTTGKKKRRRVKGWVFRSTVRCSTYRPPTASSRPRRPSRDDDESESHEDKGLTYHDFHLAMEIDVEVNREEVKRLLWSESNSRDR